MSSQLTWLLLMVVHSIRAKHTKFTAYYLQIHETNFNCKSNLFHSLAKDQYHKTRLILSKNFISNIKSQKKQKKIAKKICVCVLSAKDWVALTSEKKWKKEPPEKSTKACVFKNRSTRMTCGLTQSNSNLQGLG